MATFKVLDLISDQPVQGATVSQDGKALAQTNAAGEVTVTLQENPESVIKFSHVSYKSFSDKLKNQTPLVFLNPGSDSGDLGEIIITAMTNKKAKGIVVILVVIVCVFLAFKYKVIKP